MSTPVSVKIKFKSATADHFIERYSVDVSEGGIFIRTPKPLSVGTSVNFEFQLQDSSPLMAGGGTVVWIREMDPKKAGESPGMGIRFDKLLGESKDVLEKVLEYKRNADDFGDEPTVAGDPRQALEMAQAASAAEATGQSQSAGEVPSPGGVMPNFGATSDETVELSQASVQRRLSSLDDGDQKGPEDAPVASTEEQAEGSEAAASPVRTDRLNQILFSEDDKAPESTRPAEHPAESEMPAEETSKSSLWVWLIIIAVIAVLALLFWQLQTKKKPQVQPAPRIESSPAVKPAPAEPARISMTVTSEPEGAAVLVDGEDTGELTPAVLEELDPGDSVTVTLDLPGKKLVEKTIQPAEGETLTIALSEEAARTIRFESSPPGATVFFNGRKLGQTPVGYEDPIDLSKRHRVRIRLSGYNVANFVLPQAADWKREGVDEVWTLTTELEQRATKDKIASTSPRARIKKKSTISRPKKSSESKASRKLAKKRAASDKSLADGGVADGGARDGGADAEVIYDDE